MTFQGAWTCAVPPVGVKPCVAKPPTIWAMYTSGSVVAGALSRRVLTFTSEKARASTVVGGLPGLVRVIDLGCTQAKDALTLPLGGKGSPATRGMSSGTVN